MAISSPAGVGERAILRLSGPQALSVARDMFAPGDIGNCARLTSGPPSANTDPPSPSDLFSAQDSVNADRMNAFLLLGEKAAAPLAARRMRGGRNCPNASCATSSEDASFRPDQEPKFGTYRAYIGELSSGEDLPPIPCMLFVMRKPRSYTREDVVEFHLLSSPPLLEIIMEDVLRGPRRVRLAEPGEFTRRAFLNGRIDLVQAEAVMAAISARNEAELRRSVESLSGGISRRIRQAREALIEILAEIEAGLDFSDQDVEPASLDGLHSRMEQLKTELRRLASDGATDDAKRNEPTVVLCGPPNAGKSSLFNALVGRDAAIVTDIAGTTRDATHSALKLDGAEIRLVDSAGLSSSYAAGPDADAVAGAKRWIAAADLVVFVLDRSLPLKEPDLEALLSLGARRVILILNKSDLPPAFGPEDVSRFGVGFPIFEASSVTGLGLDGVRAAMRECVIGGGVDASGWSCVMNLRQREAARGAVASLDDAIAVVRAGEPLEFAALGLREAALRLASLTGEISADNVLDAIFSQFCIGK